MISDLPLKHSGPCACRYVRREDYAETEQIEWCGLHATQRDELIRLKAIEKAAINLCKVKGRHHSEQALKELIKACGVME